MTLDGVRWGEFPLREIFDIKPTANGIDKIKLIHGDGTYPYITRSDINNGVNTFVCEQPYIINAGGCISVGLDTQTAFYQPCDFYTGQNIQILRSPNLNAYTAKFMLPLLKKTLSIFSWGGNGATLTRLKRSKMFLPVDESGQPDYAFMERYIHAHEQRLIRAYVEHISERVKDSEEVTLDGVRWGKFAIGDLFTLITGKAKGANHLENDPAGISYLGATNRNNAVLDFVKAEDGLVQKGNCIAFIRNGEGSIGYSVYKAEDFIATSDITAGYAPFMDKYIGMFITTVADKVRGKYSFNYKRSDTRLKKEVIQLPTTQDGLPDWQLMHSYMLSLESQHLSAVISHFTAKLHTGV